jgi:hypothetical protein
MTAEPEGLGRSNRQLRELAHDALYRDETGKRKACQDCGVRFAARPWYRVRTVGHNIPLSRVVAGDTRELIKYDQCAGCNAEQGTRTPEEWRADQVAGAVQPILEITDDQKRIRARVAWEARFRRKQPGVRIDPAKVPDHLLSHAEVYRLAVMKAKITIERLPRQIAEREAKVAAEERSLAYFTALPPKKKRLFGLWSQTDAVRHRLIAHTEKTLNDTRYLLAANVANLEAAQLTLRDLDQYGTIKDCGCVACDSDFDKRISNYKEDRARERRESWIGRRSMPHPSSRRYRRRY